MPVKYQCEKCERRFVDWGAEKLGFKCPDCDEKLVAISHTRSATTSKKRPTLRKAVPKPKPKPKLVTTLAGDTSDEIALEARSEVTEDAAGDDAVADDEDTPDFSADDDEAKPPKKAKR